MPEEDKPELLWAASIYGAQTKRGLVELTVGSEKRVISPTEARAFAYSILEAAEAAETDEMIVKWLMERVKQPIENVVAVLRDFRELREGIQRRDSRRVNEGDGRTRQARQRVWFGVAQAGGACGLYGG